MAKYPEKIVTKIWIAKKLLEMGHVVKRIDYNKHNHDKAVFIFDGTNSLYRDIKFIENS